MQQSFVPHDLATALRLLSDRALRSCDRREDRLTIVAGATDFYPVRTQAEAWLQPYSKHVVDISRIEALKRIRIEADGTVVIGALATWTEVIEADLAPAFDALKQAARQVGGVQIQNRGTIAGNIANASPAADGVPPLAMLDAQVELASLRGTRRVALTAFIDGNRRTLAADDELIVAIRVPPPATGARSVFLKLGARAYLVISIVSVAAMVETDADGIVRRAAIAIGAASARPIRLTSLETAMIGMPPDAVGVTEEYLAELSPIDDVRATAAYRGSAALTLVRRAIAHLVPIASMNRSAA